MSNAGVFSVAVVLQEWEPTALESQRAGSDSQIAMVAGTIAALGVAAIFGRRAVKHWWHRKQSRQMRRRRRSRRATERPPQTSSSSGTADVRS
jgi:hypothetical protein